MMVVVISSFFRLLCCLSRISTYLKFLCADQLTLLLFLKFEKIVDVLACVGVVLIVALMMFRFRLLCCFDCCYYLSVISMCCPTHSFTVLEV
jgi:hypothetical protein